MESILPVAGLDSQGIKYLVGGGDLLTSSTHLCI